MRLGSPTAAKLPKPPAPRPGVMRLPVAVTTSPTVTRAQADPLAAAAEASGAGAPDPDDVPAGPAFWEEDGALAQAVRLAQSSAIAPAVNADSGRVDRAGGIVITV